MMSCWHFGLRFRERLATPVALVDVAVVPMQADQLVQKQTVVIDGGYIQALGPSTQVPTEGMPVINCSGKYLMPGLADMHVHCWEPTDAALYLAHGVTTVRNMRGAPIHLAMKQLVARSQVPGPHLITASPLVDGVDSNNRTTRPESLPLTDPGQASAVVKQLSSRGYEQIKAYQKLHPDVLRALGAASADAGLPLTGHCPESMSYEEAIAGGMCCFEHLTGITTGHLVPTAASSGGSTIPPSAYLKAASLFAHYIDFEKIRRLADYMAARHIWNCPTVVVNSPALQGPQRQPDPLAQYVPLQLTARWASLLSRRLGARHGVIPADHRRLVRAKVDAVLKIIRLLHEAGAPLLIGTDARNPFVYPGSAVHRELAHFVEAGLTPYEALRCATSEAARFLGEADTWGTVAQGKRADLLLLTGDPLADLRAVQEPEAVFVNGYCLSRADLNDLLAQREAWARRVERISLTSLPKSSEQPQRTLAQGTFIETRYSVPSARIGYRHQHLAGGGLLIEEIYTSAPSGVHGRTTLRLSPDLVVLRGHHLLRSMAGNERCEFNRRPDGRYDIQLTESDGRTSTTLLRADALYPSERLSVSFLPVFLGDETITGWLDGATVPALSIDNGDPGVISISLSRRDANHCNAGSGGVSWEVFAQRNGEHTIQTYRFGPKHEFIDLAQAGRLDDMRMRPERVT